MDISKVIGLVIELLEELKKDLPDYIKIKITTSDIKQGHDIYTGDKFLNGLR
ncbi:unnamed protein product [marine sediment metagenome]|uniref:Uncharacterized protein n=1 Tax=marine sediment metagenome TaxID=412755 RepID=X1RZH3_9ZZZZ